MHHLKIVLLKPFVNIFAFGFSNSPSFIYYIDAAIEYLGVVIDERKWYSKQSFSGGGYKKINEVFDNIETRLKNSSCDAMSKFINKETEITKKTIETQVTLGEVLNDLKTVLSDINTTLNTDMTKLTSLLTPLGVVFPSEYVVKFTTITESLNSFKTKVDSFLN